MSASFMAMVKCLGDFNRFVRRTYLRVFGIGKCFLRPRGGGATWSQLYWDVCVEK